MNRARLLAFVFAVSLLPTLPATARADFVTVDPRATYLRTNSDSALNAAPIDLTALSFAVNAGDVLRLDQFGEYSQTLGGPESGTQMIAVFSASSTLLPSNNLNRVADAIDAGVDFVTGATFFGGVSTDISQDFLVPSSGAGGVLIQVPVGARFLFVAAHDSLYSDNSDPDRNYGIRITAAPPQAVPAPGGFVLLSLGVGCVAGITRVRRRAV